MIDYVGTRRINRVAREIGLLHTHLHGLFYDTALTTQPRTFTTPHDCDEMLRFILRHSRTGGRIGRKYIDLLNMMLHQDDSRFIVGAVGSSSEVADKTGEIHGELNDCAIIGPFSKAPLLLSVFAHGDFDAADDYRRYEESVLRTQLYIKNTYNSVTLRTGGFKG